MRSSYKKITAAAVLTYTFVCASLVYAGATSTVNTSSSATSTTSVGTAELKKTIAAEKARLAQLTNKPQPTPGIARSLARGSTGIDVQLLQNFLKLYGTFSTTTIATGYFGSLTSQAVREFQRKESLDPIGIVGPKTRARILALSNRELAQANAHTASSTTGAVPEITSVIFSNDVGEDGSGVGLSAVFASTTRNIYAILMLSNATQDTAVGFIRYYNDVYVDSAVTHPSRTGLRYTHFQWSLKTAESRVPGQYTVAFYVNGKKSKSATFTVN